MSGLLLFVYARVAFSVRASPNVIKRLCPFIYLTIVRVPLPQNQIVTSTPVE
jgi:hypothetical protein